VFDPVSIHARKSTFPPLSTSLFSPFCVFSARRSPSEDHDLHPRTKASRLNLSHHDTEYLGFPSSPPCPLPSTRPSPFSGIYPPREMVVPLPPPPPIVPSSFRVCVETRLPARRLRDFFRRISPFTFHGYSCLRVFFFPPPPPPGHCLSAPPISILSFHFRVTLFC